MNEKLTPEQVDELHTHATDTAVRDFGAYHMDEAKVILALISEWRQLTKTNAMLRTVTAGTIVAAGTWPEERAKLVEENAELSKRAEVLRVLANGLIEVTKSTGIETEKLVEENARLWEFVNQTRKQFDQECLDANVSEENRSCHVCPELSKLDAWKASRS